MNFDVYEIKMFFFCWEICNFVVDLFVEKKNNVTAKLN